jgi:hypothetical protein
VRLNRPTLALALLLLFAPPIRIERLTSALTLDGWLVSMAELAVAAKFVLIAKSSDAWAVGCHERADAR